MKNRISPLFVLLATASQINLTLAQEMGERNFITKNQRELLAPTPVPTAGAHDGLLTPTNKNQAHKAEIEAKYPKRMFKNGEIIPYPTPEPGPRSAIYGLPDVEGEKRIEKDALEFSRKHGTAPTILVTPVPQEPEDLVYYEIPQAFIIGGCLYTNGYSYPEACSDSNGKELFRAGKDPQSKLEEIREAYGVIPSDNNIVPPTYTISPEIERELANAQGKVGVLREVNTSEIVDTGDGL